MELKNQVVSLGLAEQLKKLGVNQDSYFCWHYYKGLKSEAELGEFIMGMCSGIFISAFTVAELGELLPITVKYTKNPVGYKYQAHYDTLKDDLSGELDYKRSTASNTEADARAKMLIYLLENKLINFK